MRTIALSIIIVLALSVETALARSADELEFRIMLSTYNEGVLTQVVPGRVSER